MVPTTDANDHRMSVVHTTICQKPTIDEQVRHYSPFQQKTSITSCQGNTTTKLILKASLGGTMYTKYDHFMKQQVSFLSTTY